MHRCSPYSVLSVDTGAYSTGLWEISAGKGIIPVLRLLLLHCRVAKSPQTCLCPQADRSDSHFPTLILEDMFQYYSPSSLKFNLLLFCVKSVEPSRSSSGFYLRGLFNDAFSLSLFIQDMPFYSSILHYNNKASFDNKKDAAIN
jgi:hypothetical protein